MAIVCPEGLSQSKIPKVCMVPVNILHMQLRIANKASSPIFMAKQVVNPFNIAVGMPPTSPCHSFPCSNQPVQDVFAWQGVSSFLLQMF